jgi:hypothetical protein
MRAQAHSLSTALDDSLHVILLCCWSAQSFIISTRRLDMALMVEPKWH